MLLEQAHDLVHQGQLLLLTLGFRQRSQSGLAELPEVAGQALGSFSRIEGLELVKRCRRAGEGQMERRGERVVVEAGMEILRGHGCDTGRMLLQS